ncbi:MAG: Rne/Rng family ribonuclease [Proteobacteria bacterium]|nr:MAG: Rne/Rng family ribonuclease [Pseudomonadota bacterium]PIE17526.1 MAG: Rne/Rng family ribonuclease [Pseudomonadota bacterium]
MAHQLLINAESYETRVALVESGVLVELHIERESDRGIVGNIYKGRVVRVLPGMQAAFVDIGIGKAAFLYADDVLAGADEPPPNLAVEESEESGELVEAEAEPIRRAPIQDRLREGEEVLVQVAKDPIGSKGARVTSYVSLPGRHLVLMPTVDHVGVSRRITEESERQRLREVVENIRPEGVGFIVRTVAEGHTEESLRADMEFLLKLWDDISRRRDAARSPSLIYSDLDLALRMVRDLVSENVRQVVVDDVEEFKRISDFIATFMPRYDDALELYQGAEPLFDAHGIEHEIDRALERKVWLKSGGYLVIDQSEALTAVDVNTGRYVGRRNLEDTITRTNLEAVRELATQLRLRNIGGIIIVDFIDMEQETNRQKVWRALNEALTSDRARSNVLPISDLGLVEMTRQRVRDSLYHQLAEACPHCEGRGVVKTAVTVCYEVLREIARQAASLPDQALTVLVHPEVADLLADAEREHLVRVERRAAKEVSVEPRPNFHVEQFAIHVKVD